MNIAGLEDEPHVLEVVASGAAVGTICSSIRFHKAQRNPLRCAGRDQDNAIGEWKERGILGTQLGPNKNGRKW
jgi:hypothetical protein